MRHRIIALLLSCSLLSLSAATPTKDAPSASNATTPTIQTAPAIQTELNEIEMKLDHISENTEPENHWYENLDWWNLIAAGLAFLVACFSLLFDYKGFRASKRTADNVTRVTSEVQIHQFEDLIRHLYRNLICCLAFGRRIRESREERKQDSGKNFSYPSEEHLLKLKVLPEDVIHLEKYNDTLEIYKDMHELKLQLRNYDVEIETTIVHMKDENLSATVLDNDMDTLYFKPMFLIDTIAGLTQVLNNRKRKNGKNTYDAGTRTAEIITEAHLKNIEKNIKEMDPSNFIQIVPPPQPGDKEKPQLYDGLRRSSGILFKRFKDIGPMPKVDGYLKNNEFQEEIKNAFADLSIPELDEYKDEVLKQQYDFKKYFWTAVSIDVAIEVEKMHMVEIERKN